MTTRVLYDHEAFIRHTRSGITRYLSELIGEFRTDQSLGVTPVTPYRWVANAHLASQAGYTQVRLPAGRRVRVLERLNRGRAARSLPAEIVHHSLYEPDALRRWQAPLRVTNIYDFTFERLPDVFPDAAPEIAKKNAFIEASDALLCISNTTRDDLLAHRPNLDKYVAVTPLGVAQAFFRPQRARIRQLPERYVLHVGNRHGHKNAMLLFRAFERLSRRHPDLYLVLCGAAVPEETDQLERLGISGRTIRMRVDDHALPWLYHAAQAFVFPSRYEGFGLPVVEAMAAGCPTVASDIAVMHEVGDDAVRYVGCDDVDGLADTLERLLADSAECRRMSQAGRLRATQFTWRRTAETTAAAYRDLRALKPTT